MRIAVVGGSGFVGKHLLTRLRALDIPACSLDISPPPPVQQADQDADDPSKHYQVDITDLQQVR